MNTATFETPRGHTMVARPGKCQWTTFATCYGATRARPSPARGTTTCGGDAPSKRTLPAATARLLLRGARTRNADGGRASATKPTRSSRAGCGRRDRREDAARGVVVAAFLGDRCHLIDGERFYDVLCEMEGLDASALHFRVLQWLRFDRRRRGPRAGSRASQDRRRAGGALPARARRRSRRRSRWRPQRHPPSADRASR